ncbi:MAG: hypothetical protein M0Z27_03105 [Thermaerobacter sp.]|jgi:hypothetical protein|nr:hypothetical protein [Thermaerobacter sp.]MDA8145037.1 hypothetical protein [Thermaerobacter sp.]
MISEGGPRSQLFTVRLWREQLNGDREELRGQVRDVASGEERYFRDWADLERFLREKLPPGKASRDG